MEFFFLGLDFSTSVIVSYFSFFLGLTGSWIDSFLIIKVSGVFFFLFFRWIQRISGVKPAKSSPYKEKSEKYLLSLRISISMGFSIPVLVLDKLVTGIYLDLSTVLTVSVF